MVNRNTKEFPSTTLEKIAYSSTSRTPCCFSHSLITLLYVYIVFGMVVVALLLAP